MENKIIDISKEIIGSPDGHSDNNEQANGGNADPNYWRSFRELYNDPEFNKLKEREFAEGALDRPDVSRMSGLSRRKFLALMSASAAVAASGCSNFREGISCSV